MGTNAWAKEEAVILFIQRQMTQFAIPIELCPHHLKKVLLEAL